MKSMCFIVCLALMSHVMADISTDTWQDINIAVDKILVQLHSNIENADQSLGINNSDIMSKIDDIEKSVMTKIGDIENRFVAKAEEVEDKMLMMKLHALYGKGELPCNCMDIMKRESTRTGVYNIYVKGRPIQVYCDMKTDGGGWLVFQRRRDGSVNFDKKWHAYRNGFGNIVNEFWLGNENLYDILNSCGRKYEIRIELEGDIENVTIKQYAKYSTFNINDRSDQYRLTVDGYSGDAGDSFSYHNEGQFSTRGRDNDGSYSEDFAAKKKAGWWFKSNSESNLNGLYVWRDGTYTGSGIQWNRFALKFARSYLLKYTEMKIRPKL